MFAHPSGQVCLKEEPKRIFFALDFLQKVEKNVANRITILHNHFISKSLRVRCTSTPEVGVHSRRRKTLI